MQVNPGDIVRYLNAVGGGRVVKVDGRMAYVEEDGFETPVLVSECVVVSRAGDKPQSAAPVPRVSAPAAVVPVPRCPEPEPEAESSEDIPGGDILNIVLGFEPADIKRLSDTSFDAYLVNDSNYDLWLTVATRPAGDGEWTLRHRGHVEAGMQEFLFELTVDDLPEIDRIAVQILPYKTSRAYKLLAPVAFEQRLDATRFARLHCFTANPYFDSKVLALDIVTDGQVKGRTAPVDAAAVERAMKQKVSADLRPRRRENNEPKADPNAPLEIDLHIGELLDSTAGMSKADMLNYQIDTFRKVMDSNLRNVGREIIFIHGKGEGVLRQALMKELNHRYKGHDVSDASFREYGFGATRVVIRKVSGR